MTHGSQEHYFISDGIKERQQLRRNQVPSIQMCHSVSWDLTGDNDVVLECIQVWKSEKKSTDGHKKEANRKIFTVLLPGNNI